MARIEGLGAWPSRALWLVLAVISTSTFDAALSGRATPIVLVAATLLGLGWAAGAVALLVPRSTSLTAIRVVVPAAMLAVVWAVAVGDGVGAIDVVTAIVAALATASVLAPWVTEAFVDGSAYGPERRTPLRTPVLLLLLGPLSWALIVAGTAAGPMLLAARQWAVGGVALVIGWPLAAAATRSLHQLSRRWVVIVPAGLVIHDPITMPEPQLFLRRTIAKVGAATTDVDPDAVVTQDLSAGASGLVLAMELSEPVELLLRDGRGQTKTRAVSRVLFAPTRPVTVLDSAKERRIPVG
jgi:hypothetical protein